MSPSAAAFAVTERIEEDDAMQSRAQRFAKV
jgi:hypothetical protein